jgi:hypothetical protein
MTAPRPESTVRVSPSVYARPFGEEIVLLHFARGEYYGLDPIAARVWERLVLGETLESAARFVAEHYDVSVEEALRDIQALVVELGDQSLVELA